MNGFIAFDNVEVRSANNEKVVKVSFDRFTVKDTSQIGTVRVLMLKGEKGNDGDVSFDSLTPAQKAELKGDQGEQGVGIASTVLNQDYTLTITLTDGTSYTTSSIRGATGQTGATGATGNGIQSAVLNSDYTLTLTFTDGTSYTTTSIRGATGATGATGQTGATGATGNGIASTVLNSDYTLTITFTDGTSYTTSSIRGATGATGQTGATGNGIQSAVLNADYTLTLTFTDGTTYTTPSIRGEKGEQGDDYVLTNQDKADIAALVTLPSSGWVDLTDYAVTNNVTIEPTQWGAIRIGNMVQLYLGFNPKTDWAVGSEYNIIENLPAKLRPSIELQLVCWAQHPFAMVRVGTDGTIKACQRSGQSRGTSFWIRAHVSYICNAAWT